MRLATLLAGLLLAFAAFTATAAAQAPGPCSDAVTPATCQSLVCVPTLTGARFCSSELSPDCFTDPCPGFP